MIPYRAAALCLCSALLSAMVLSACESGSGRESGAPADPAADAACAAPLPGSAAFDAMVAARQHLLGAENVDAATGAVVPGRAVLSWFGIASFAAALNGRVVLLDGFIQSRTERPGYVPTSVDELIALRPEAIFVGHGHGDHGELVSRIAGATCAVVVGTPEHCAQFGEQWLADGGEQPLSCLPVTAAGSGFGEVVDLDAFAPDLCITAFRHPHSDAVPPDPERIPNPPLFFPDPTSVLLHPPGVPSEEAATGLGGDEGGSLFYQFRMRDFSLVWTDTTGPVKEAAPQLFDLMRGLPATDVMLGAIIGFNVFTNGFRDPAMYAEAVAPQLFIPNHHDFIAPDGSQDDWQATFQRDLDAIPAERRPELRWMLNPYDYVRPGLLTFSLDDPRWAHVVAQRPSGACF